MPLLDDVAARLEAVGAGVVKTASNNPTWPIFKTIAEGQPGVSGAIFLVPGPGFPPVQEMTAVVGQVVFENPSLVVQVRHASLEAAILKAEEIWSRLHNLAEVVLGATRYLRIEARRSPFPIGRDKSNLHIVSCDYDVAKERG